MTLLAGTIIPISPSWAVSPLYPPDTGIMSYEIATFRIPVPVDANDTGDVEKTSKLLISSNAHHTEVQRDADKWFLKKDAPKWYSKIIGKYKGQLRVGFRKVYATIIFDLVDDEIKGTFILRGLKRNKLIKGKIQKFSWLDEKQAQFNYVTDGSKGVVKITFSKNFDGFEGHYIHKFFGKFGPWYSKRMDND
jgi:hypothetical protein